MNEESGPLEEYIQKTTAPVLNVSSLWEEKTGKSWTEAKALGLTDGTYSKNMELLNTLKSNANQESIPYIGGTTDLNELAIIAPREKRIREQQMVVKRGEYNQDQPYAIVDKGQNDLFLFGNDHNMISREKVITGKDNRDSETALSMKGWYQQEENKGKTHDDYFKYLDDSNQQVTSAGMFTIGKHRKDVTENPDMLGNIINFFRPGRKKEIKESREKAYGKRGELLTMYDENGVYSSKAIHGTGYEDRVKAIASGKGGNLSNGCINVGGKSLCFETLEEGSRVFIMPEENNGLVKPTKKKDEVKPQGALNKFDQYSRDLMYKLKERGLDVTEEEAKKIYTIHTAESKLGDGYGIKDTVLDNLGVSKSKGEFQINSDTMKEYITNPEYNFKDTTDRAAVVLDFIRQNQDLSISELYNKYNTGSVERNSKNKDKIRKMQRILGIQ